MPVATASLANLRPPWQPGDKVARRSAEISKAIRDLRRWSPKAVKYLGNVVEDENEATSDRIRAAIAIIDKVIPDASVENARMLGASGAAMLRIEIIDPEGASETVTIRPAPALEHKPES